MIIMLFICFLTITSFSLFDFSLKLNSVNRAIIYTPMEIFTTSIPLSELKEGEAYFIKEDINNKLQSYYQRVVSSYIDDYSYSLYYYNQSDGSYCIGELCDAVEVTFDCNISLFYKYHRVMFYEIKWRNLN